MARPVGFSQELADQVMDRIAEGEMLTKICEGEDMPTARQFRYWLSAHEHLTAPYARARLSWADTWAEKVMDISFNPQGAAIDQAGNAVMDHATIALLRLQTDNAKWLVGKWAPRTYGDKPAELPTEPVQTLMRIERVIVDNNPERPPPPPPPPAQLTYDPGPIPSRLQAEVLSRFVTILREHVPNADQREPAELIDEAMHALDRAMRIKYAD